MSGGGIDDLIGSLTGGGGGGGGLGQILGGLFGGGGTGGGGGGASMMSTLAPILGGLLASGGLQKMLSGFQNAGQGDKVDSWVSTGENQPISGQEVRQALPEEEIDQVARGMGVSQNEAADVLAGVLPNLVDKVSPEGQLPSQNDLDRLAGALQAQPQGS